MKLASVRHRNHDLVAAELAAGELVAVDTLLALPAARGARATGSPGVKMRDLIRGGAAFLDALGAALAAARADGSVERIATPEVTWHPPVRRPGKICAVAMNNSASNERKISAPDHPAFFLKPASCLVGHGQPIRIRRYYGSVHPEPELALVIGRETRDVAGYAGTRLRVRLHHLQRHHGQRHARRRPVPLLGRVREEEQPERDGARRAALVLRGPLQGHRHVRGDGPVARDEGRDCEPGRPSTCNARSAARSSRTTARATTTTRWPRS